MTVETYATLDEAATYIGQRAPSRLLAVGWALDGAHEAVDHWTGRSFATVTTATDRVYAASMCDLLDIDDFWDVDEVKLDLDGDGTFEVTLTTADYRTLPLNGRKGGIAGHAVEQLATRPNGTHRWPVTPDHDPRVQVTGKPGWAAVPATIKNVTLELAKDIFKASDFVAGAIGFEAGIARIRDTPSLQHRLKPFARVDGAALGGIG